MSSYIKHKNSQILLMVDLNLKFIRIKCEENYSTTHFFVVEEHKKSC